MKNSRMPRCCQFSEDHKEPSAGRSRSATDKLGDTARAEKWRNPGNPRRELFGASLDVAPQLQPLEGMLLRRSTDIYPKELARDMREFFNSLLVDRISPIFESSGPVRPPGGNAVSHHAFS